MHHATCDMRDLSWAATRRGPPWAWRCGRARARRAACRPTPWPPCRPASPCPTTRRYIIPHHNSSTTQRYITPHHNVTPPPASHRTTPQHNSTTQRYIIPYHNITPPPAHQRYLHRTTPYQTILSHTTFSRSHLWSIYPHSESGGSFSSSPLLLIIIEILICKMMIWRWFWKLFE